MALRVTRQYNEALAAGVGELRVTRQHVDVLAAGVGKLRVSQQFVEVLGVDVDELLLELESATGLTQNVTFIAEWARSPSHTLNLSQDAEGTETFHLDIESEMNLASVLSRVLEANASSTMNLVQDHDLLWVEQERLTVNTAINFAQQADWWVDGYHNITHDLGLTSQAFWIGPRFANVLHSIPFFSAATGIRGTPWAPVLVGHTLNLLSTVGLSYLLDTSSVITMTQDMYRGEVVESSMSLAQSLESGKLIGMPPTEIALAQTVNLTGTFTRTLEHTSVVGHSLTYYIGTACNYKQYTPFIGESTISNAPTPPASSEPFVTHDPAVTRFKLTYPAISAPTDEVELRAPELDNIERIAFNRINRETRGGKLTVFADPNWPKTQTIVATFIGLTQTEIDNLLDFFVTHVGAEIGMQDWEGREWIGVITTPNETAVQDGASCTGRGWTITFEFEGVLVENYARGDKLDLADSIGIELIRVRGLSHDLAFTSAAVFLLEEP